MAAFFGISPAANYMNQSTFENKVTGQYYKDFPQKGSAYERDIQKDYRVGLADSQQLVMEKAIAASEGDQSKVQKIEEKLQKLGYDENGETKDMRDAKAKLQKLGMSTSQINNMKKDYTTPFSQFAWKKLPAETQINLYPSATDAEKKIFYNLMKPEAKSQFTAPE